MTHVVFVGGLQGKKALSYTFTSAIGPNEQAVRDASKGYHFTKLNYQSKGSINPILSQMECSVARQLHNVINDAKGEPIVAVGSSVGFGVLVGALSRLENTTSPIALLGFKPVPDPLMAIELQIKDPQALAAIKRGIVAEAPMPVEGNDGLQDVFMLSARHLNDKYATRILTKRKDATHFDGMVARTIASSTLIHGANDHLTPSSHMVKFANASGIALQELIELKGTHATDFTDALRTQTSLMIARFG